MVPVRLVLLRPRNADNLGAIARAMKNFALTDWVVVSPNPRLLEVPGLNRLAVKSGELLETVRRVETFDEALADCTWVVGTTMRRIEGRQRLAPREVATEAVARGGKLALVFGDERSGMSNEDLARCHALSFIPASDAQPSLNLAQAVVLYAWELFAAAMPAGAAPLPAQADDGAIQGLRADLSAALLSAGFLQNEERSGVDELLGPLLRGRLSKKEAELWKAALKTLGKALGRAQLPPVL
jgi:tRNA/rRNA methyltransferase